MKRIQYLLTILITLAWASCNTKHNTIEDHWNDAMEQVEDLADATEDAVDDAADFVEDAYEDVEDATKKVVKDAKKAKKKVAKQLQQQAASVQTAVKSMGRKLELPGRLKHTPERIIEHTGYTLSFNREHNNPNWVAWELTATEAQGNLPRVDNFQPDPMLPENHQVRHADYTRSGYDRGHMVPAADMKWSSKAMNDCFYMSNICPQTGTLNSGGWETLESACRRWAVQEGSVYIVCGPVYSGTKHKTIGKDLQITVPEGFFKVVLSMRKGAEKAIGFYYANSNAKQRMETTATTVDAIEQLTGMDFFVNIDDRLEARIESTFSLKRWK